MYVRMCGTPSTNNLRRVELKDMVLKHVFVCILNLNKRYGT